MTNVAARDIEHVLHPISNIKAHSEGDVLVVDRGEGIFVFDTSGRKLIEGCSGAWCLALGYGDEELVNAAAAQMRKLAYAPGFFNRTTEPVVDLAEKLKSLAPFEASKVLFVNSGSEANDSQVRLLWYYNNLRGKPRKKKIISRWGSYHGTGGLSASLTGLNAFHQDFDAPEAFVRHAGCPHYYRHAEPGESEADFTDRMVRELEELILREDPDTVAAIILDPVQASAGVLIPPDGYLSRVQEVAAKHDVRIVADEVICGFGRTGAQWGCDTYNLKPESMSLAKQLSSAYLPIGAVVIDGELYDSLIEGSRRHGTLGHGFTYSGHPVAAAVALRTIELYEERDILRRSQATGEHFAAGLRSLQDHPLVGEVQAVGLLAGVELVADKQTKTRYPAAVGVGAYCLARCEHHGLTLRATADRMMLAPPMIITEDEIDLMLSILQQALDDTLAWVRKTNPIQQ